MGRQTAIWKRTSCAKGVNQEIEQASFQECADALNVWAPNGGVEQRPGYTGVGSFPGGGASQLYGAVRSHIFAKDETAPGTYTVGVAVVDISDARARSAAYTNCDKVYVGVPTIDAACTGFSVAGAGTSTNLVWAKMEYWNGTNWKPLAYAEYSQFDIVAGFRTGSNFQFVPPQDIVTTTVLAITGTGDTTELYFYRFNLYESTSDDLDATTSINIDAELLGEQIATSITNVRGLFEILIEGKKNYIFVGEDHVHAAGKTYLYFSHYEDLHTMYEEYNNESIIADQTTLAHHVIVPEFEDNYIVRGNQVYYVRKNTANPLGDSSVKLKAVESRDFAVGEGAPYDKDLIASEDVWPEPNFMMYRNNRLWAVMDNHVRWSAPIPYHNVWPSLQVENLAEEDKGVTTGIAGYGEHIYVFKRNSIWQLVDVGTDANELLSIAPIKIAASSGVGCTAYHSIQEVQGGLFFMAEDGIYRFDGKKPEKISDRISEIFGRIVHGRAGNITSVNWREANMYLLAVPVDGALRNNYVLAYDYKQDAWWIWNNMEVSAWMQIEDTNDTSQIYFVDHYGHLFLFDSGITDHGAGIEASVTTQRAGYKHHDRKRLRHVYVHGSNRMGSTSVQVIPDGDTINTNQRIGTMDFSANSEIGIRQKRKRRNDFRVDAQHIQVKVSHSDRDKFFVLDQIDLGMKRLGPR